MGKKAAYNTRRVVSLLASGALAFVGVSASVLAGPRYTPPGVQIFVGADGSGFAEGTLGGTRNSANLVERITCTVSRDENLSATGALLERDTLLVCIARNADGRTVSCASESETIANELRGLSNAGLLRFSFNEYAQCTGILIYESSSLETKH